MAEPTSTTDRVLGALVSAGFITAEQLTSARDSATSTGANVGQVLVDHGLVSVSDVAAVLEDELGIPQVDLASYAPDASALELVPSSLARARHALPLFEIEGMLTVAIGDPFDVFMLDSLAAEIQCEIEPVLADPASVNEQIAAHYGSGAETVAAGEPAAEPEGGEAGAVAGDEADAEAATLAAAVPGVVEEVGAATAPVPSAAPGQPAVPSPEAAPSHIDLDVLAVADIGRVAVLVSDILEHAVSRGASRIHLLPYKDDFFLVYRVKGRLESIGSAALSMQGALADGFKAFARMPAGPAAGASIGKVRARILDKDLTLTVSAVPTVSGQRVVVSLAPYRGTPHDLTQLGMTDAEAKALGAMMERGRGMLLLFAPIAGGVSATYYALLAHAATVGKTVYSVERSVEYELPEVAQVTVDPASPTGAASYLAAGIRQDTDVVSIDGLRTVDEAHLAIEAAGMGKLVIASVTAGDIASGLRRLLDLGAEPHSLSPVLTMAVGQRLVRMVCPNCSGDVRDPLAAQLPGVGETTKAGSGCPNCGKSGFQGVTGLFEVLLFNEQVRGAVARDASRDEIEAAALAAGMRPLLTSGVAKVASGSVSASELDRVLRFSGQGV